MSLHSEPVLEVKDYAVKVSLRKILVPVYEKFVENNLFLTSDRVYCAVRPLRISLRKIDA